MNCPTGTVLERYLSYSPLSGEFTWKVSRSANALAGQIAGCVANDGYVQIYIDGKPFKAHILAWAWMTGEWPSHRIDHRDLNKTNNAWSNLRAASQSQNAANCLKRRTNKSGFKGVCFDASRGLWIAQIQVMRKRVFLGAFDRKEDAASAYANGAEYHFGEFARIA